jgi:tetratricopeptide (TPR) repeat protein
MKPQSKVSFFRNATSVLTIAALGISSAALWGAPAAPPAALTPEQISKLLEDGTTVLKGGNPELAIKNYFEPVNQSFMRQTAKAGADDEIYATHSATETSAYSARVAKNNEGSSKPTKMVTVDGAWTDALVLKARAQAQLKQIPAAKSTLEQATVISPAWPLVWIELGSLYREEKNWENSFKAYKQGESFAGAVEEKAAQTQVLATALRGQAAALIEMGRLDDAETLYKRCLKMNPADTEATEGLAQVAAKKGTSAPAAGAPAAGAPAAPAPAPR